MLLGEAEPDTCRRHLHVARNLIPARDKHDGADRLGDARMVAGRLPAADNDHDDNDHHKHHHNIYHVDHNSSADNVN